MGLGQNFRSGTGSTVPCHAMKMHGILARQLTGNGQSICMLCRGRDSRVVARDKKVRDLVLLEHLSVLLKLLSLEERREAKGIIFQSLVAFVVGSLSAA